jgi:hypothetical protein
MLAPHSTPKLEDYPLTLVRGCLFNIFAQTTDSISTTLPEYLLISSVTPTHPKMRAAIPMPYCRLFELSNTRSKTRLQMRERPTSGPESLGSSGGLCQFDDLLDET